MVIALAVALGGVLALPLLVPFGLIRPRRRVRLLANALAALAGAGVGLAAGALSGWLSSPAWLASGTIVGAALGLALLNLAPASFGRRLLALAAVPCFGVAAVGVAGGIPSIFGAPAVVPAVSGTARAQASAGARAPHQVRSGAGYRGIPRWRIPVVRAASMATSVGGAHGPNGRVGSVVIPGSRSGFRGRPAMLYLPPAALTAHPPGLPVVVALSGQSRYAGPYDVFAGGRMASIMNAIAHAHGGVAPIVVVPDQLGAGPKNPMCVDSPLGNVATYLTVDVRHWILAHLPVADDRQDWTIAGFSEGGTCAIQLGAGRPDLFGSLVDISGERAPLNGTLAHTVDAGFSGSARAYAAASPLNLLGVHHYPASTTAYFAVGALDTHYGPVAPVMARHAQRAGMTVHYRRFAHLRHNWATGSAGFRWAMESLAAHSPAESAGAAAGRPFH